MLLLNTYKNKLKKTREIGMYKLNISYLHTFDLANQSP